VLRGWRVVHLWTWLTWEAGLGCDGEAALLFSWVAGWLGWCACPLVDLGGWAGLGCDGEAAL
jgi:hypothetical protein